MENLRPDVVTLARAVRFGETERLHYGYYYTYLVWCIHRMKKCFPESQISEDFLFFRL